MFFLIILTSIVECVSIHKTGFPLSRTCCVNLILTLYQAKFDLQTLESDLVICLIVYREVLTISRYL